MNKVQHCNFSDTSPPKYPTTGCEVFILTIFNPNFSVMSFLIRSSQAPVSIRDLIYRIKDEDEDDIYNLGQI